MSVTLGELPKERQARAALEDHENAGDEATLLGLILAPAAKVMDSSSEGVVVTAIDLDGQAARHGLKVGDGILDVGSKMVSSAADVRDAPRDGLRRWQTNSVDADQVRRRDDVRRGGPTLIKRFNVVGQTKPSRGHRRRADGSPNSGSPANPTETKNAQAY
jgi:hypothetical protein